MELTLALEICEDESSYTDIKTVSIDSLDVNLEKTIKPLIPRDYIITFDHYYSNNFIMSEEGCVPYLQINGKLEWNVPYETISVRDFIISNEIDDNRPIVVNVDSGLGGNDIDFTGVLDWLIFALPAIKEGLETTASLFTFIDYSKRIHKLFGGKNKKLANPDDVCEAIQKRETWTLGELKRLMGADDVRIINICMAGSGYRKVGNKYYKKNTILKQMVSGDYYEKKLWGKYKLKNDGYDDICQLVHDFNKNLTQLMYQSYYYHSDCFEIMLTRVDIFLSTKEKLLKRGKYFNFIKVSKKKKRFDINTTDSIMKELQILDECMDDFFCYLEEKEIPEKPV